MVRRDYSPGLPMCAIRWRVVIACAVLAAYVLFIAYGLALTMIQLRLTEQEWGSLILALAPRLAVPPTAILTVCMVVTCVDYVRRHGWHRALRWIPLFVLLNHILIILYWYYELRHAIAHGRQL